MVGGDIVERVIIQIEAITKSLDNSLNKVTSSIKNMNERWKEAAPIMNLNLEQYQKLNKVSEMTNEQLRRFIRSLNTDALKQFGIGLRKNDAIYDLNTNKFIKMGIAQTKIMEGMNKGGVKVANSLRNLVHGMHGFRMEALGVMFFGMMLANTFQALLNPVMEAYGVFEIWNAMLTVVMLPVMDLIFPILLKFIEFFMNLPEPVQMAIGILTVLAVIIGSLLFVFGSLILGIGSLIIMNGALAAMGLSIMAIATPILIIIGVIAALIAIFYIINAVMEHFGITWGDIWNGLVGIVTYVFDLITTPIKIFAEFIRGFISGLVDKEVTWEEIWNGFWKVVSDIWTWIQDKIDAVWKYIGPIIEGGIGKIRDFIQWIKDGLGWVGKMAGGAGKFLGSSIRGGINLFTNSKDDFIWRSGEGAISINPNDNIVGYKDESPFGGGGSYNITINNIFNGFTKDELQREIDNSNRRIVDEIRRQVRL